MHYVIEHQARYLVIFRKKGVLLCKMYIRSGMFSFGLTNFLSLSDRMSDMLKKFSTSLNHSTKIELFVSKTCLISIILELA